MAEEFKLPDLGEGIESGDVVQVHVSEGDTIDAEQTVVEVETDKAVLEVPCPFGGKVTGVHVSQGDKVQVGAKLITVDANGQASGDTDSKDAPAEEEKAEAKEPESPPEEETKGAPAPAEAKEPEKPEKAEQESATKKEEKPSEQESAPSRPERKPPARTESGDTREDDANIPAGPATRRLARELGVELRDLAAAYPNTRLTEQHVKDFVKGDRGEAGGAPSKPASSGAAAPAQNAAAQAASGDLPDFTQWGEIEPVAFSSLQRKTADHLHNSWVTAPHVTQFDEAEIDALEKLRKRYREREPELRLTVTAFILKAVAVALKAFPEFNSSLDTQNSQLILKKYYHIGLAVDTEAGLIVPVLRNVDKKRVLELAKEMNEIAERTRQRKVELSELRGGTFTVTNLGGIGGTAFTPIINYPEVAILGVSRGRKVPTLENGSLTTKLMLPLSLSYDHRVVNGADGARFLRKVVDLLEDPELLLLEG